MALTRQSSDRALMLPPPPPRRAIKRPAQVLDEDDYTDALSHIIARDFFPGLVETNAQKEYLDALESKDSAWIASAGQALEQVMTPKPAGRRSTRAGRGTRFTSETPVADLGETPRAWQGDTPVSVASSRPQSESSQSDVNTSLRLGQFQQKYTSEDNESFYKLLDKQNKKRADDYAWMWAGNKIPAARQIAYRERQRLRAAEKAERSSEQDSSSMQLIKSTDDRPAMPESWASAPNNGLMFNPDSVEDTVGVTVAQAREQASFAPPKAIVYQNTRLSELHNDTKPGAVPDSPSLSAVQDAIAGRPRPSASDASTIGTTLPSVKGYTFVDSEEPLSQPTVNADNLLPRVEEGTPKNPFKLHESSKREALHHRMVDKVAKSNRASGKLRPGKSGTPALATPKFGSSPGPATPRFTSSPRVDKAGLTPAAERLLGRVGAASSRSAGGIWEGKGRAPRRSGLREMLTPKTRR